MTKGEKPKSEVFFKRIHKNMTEEEEITLSVQSQTDKGAWSLFMKLKKEMKIE